MKKKLLIHPEELTRKWIDTMARLGVQVLGLHPVGGRNADESLSRLLLQVEDPEIRTLLDYAAEKGLNIEYEIHAMSSLLPRALYEAHPEYFRMDRDGRRVPDWNFCFSDEKALDDVTDHAVSLAGKFYRSTHQFYFWLDDSRDAYCHCDKCAGLSPSDQQLLAMNAIVGKLREVYPDAKLAYLAYMDTITLPEKIKPAPGIFLEYAPIDRDMKKSVRTMPPEEQENIRRLLQLFGKEDAWVLEYWLDNSLFSNWKKPPVRFQPDNAMIRDDIAFYREMGFDQISSFACYLGEDYEALYGAPDISSFGD